MAVKNKKTQSGNRSQNYIESPLGGIIGGAAKTIKDDLMEKGISTAWKQLLGNNKDNNADKASNHAASFSGDLAEGQEIDFSQKQEKKTEIEPGIDYQREIIHAETRILRTQENELSVKIEQIMIELKKLSESSRELSATIKDVVIETAPVNPGKYHLNFFEFVLQAVKEARLKIENSAAWLNAVGNKKNKKDFWNMSKRHGTTFSLSSERVVSQQVG